jgi:dipeptidyl aminopeptidase/acylaminoacyl peptidase
MKMTAKRCIQKTDLFRYKFLNEAHLSPDGKKVVYNITHIDAEKEIEYSVLWMLDLETQEDIQFTSGKTRDYGAAWSPDGNNIAFISVRDGAPQVFLIPADGGEARPLTNMKQGVGSSPLWSPDGKFLAFTAGAAVEMPAPGTPYRVTRNIYRFNGMGYIDPIVQDIYIIPIEGGEPRQLTHDRYNNGGLAWSPDGQEILYNYSFDPNSHSMFGGLRSVNMKGEVRDLVTKKWGAVMEAAWSPDCRSIVFSGTPDEIAPMARMDLYTIRRHGSLPECHTAGLKIGLGSVLQGDMPAEQLAGGLKISRDGKNAYALVQDGGNVGVYEIALTGAESYKPFLGGERTAVLLDFDNKHLLYAASTINDPINLFVADMDGKNEKQITHLNDKLNDEFIFPEVEHLYFKGSNGDRVEGWLMRPTTEVKAPYPTVLYIHGGPMGAFGNIYSFDFQMLAGAGYAVLYINPHGSTGYGREFCDCINGDTGNLDYKDLMLGVDHVIEKGLADADKLGVCGLSYGGYMTTWIVGQTDRFKAAVPENPVTNWHSLYGVSDISADLCHRMFGGKPFEKMEAYKRTSPITYAHKCKTPTLLVQGEADYRCPAEQSEQFYVTLKANGCITEMVRLPGASHAGSIMGEPIIRRTQNEVLLEWMDKYVLGKN